MNIRKMILPPVHDDFERTQKAAFLHYAFMVVAIALLAFGLLNLGWGAIMLGKTLIAFSGVCTLGFILNKYKYYVQAAFILSAVIYISIFYNLIDGAALHDPGVAAIPIFTLLTGLLFERKMIPIHTLISILGTVGVYYFWNIGLLELSQAPTENRVIILTILQLVTGFITWVILSTYRNTINRLDRSEQRYERLFENVPVGLFRTTLEGKFLDANQAFIKMFGYPSRAALLETNATKFYVDPNDRLVMKSKLDQDSLVKARTVQLHRHDGEVIWVEDYIRSIQDENQQTLYEGATLDITARKQAEDTLRASAERDRVFIENNTAIIYNYEIQPPMPLDLPVEEQINWLLHKSKLVEANEAYAQSIDIQSIDEILGMTILDAWAGDHTYGKEILRDFIQRGYHFKDYETPETDYQGRYVWSIHNTFSVIEDDHLVRIWGTTIDITRLKEAEQDLAASEARYRNLVENIDDLIYRYEFTPERRFSYVSPSAEKMTGYSPEEHYADPDLGYKLVHPEDRHLLDGISAAENQDLETLTLRWTKKDGGVIWTEQRNTSIYDDGGNLIAIEGIARDITEQKQAETALAESEAMFRGFAELSFQGIYLYKFDPPISTDLPKNEQVSAIYRDGVRVWCNDYFAQMYGRDREDLIGGSLYDTHGSDNSPENVAWIKDWISSGYRKVGALSSEIDQDGNQIWITNNVIGILKDGALIEAWGTQMDVTEHRQAEVELQIEQNFNKAIIEASPIFFIAIDHQGKTKLMNESMLSTLGYSPEEVLGRDYMSLFVPEREHETISKIFEEQLPRDRVSLNENHVLTKIGEELLVEWHGRSVLDPNGEVDYFFGYGIDITEKRRAEQEIKESEIKLRAFFEHSNVPIGVSKGGVHAMANPAYLEMFGYDSFEELENVPLLEKIAPSERPRIREFVKLREEGNPSPNNYQTKGLRKDGTEVPIEVFVTQFELDGEVFTSAFFNDLSEQKKIEKELRSTQMHYTDFINASSDGVAYWKLPEGLKIDLPAQEQIEMLYEMVCVDANRGAWEAYGLDNKNDLIGKKYIELVEGKMLDQYFTDFINNNYRLDNYLVYDTPLHGKEYYGLNNSYGVVENGELVNVWDNSKNITDLKMAEIELKDSETKLNAIFDHHFQLTGLLDLEGRILAANKTVLDFAGVNEADVLGIEIWEGPWWDKSQEREVRSALKRAKDGEFIRFETTHLDAVGEIHDMDFSFSPVFDDEDNVIYIVPEARDITKRKQAEEALLESETRFRKIFDNNPNMMALIDIETRSYLDVNQAYCQISGYSKKEFITLPGNLGILAKSDADTDKALNLYKENGLLSNFEITLSTKKGDEIIGLMFIEPVEIQGKHHQIATLVEITERKRAEANLQKSEERFKAAASAMSDLVWESDHVARTLEWFGDVDRVLGYKPGEFPRTLEAWKNAVHPEDQEKVRNMYDKTLEVGDEFFAEYRIHKKDGSILYWEDRGITAETQNGEVVRSVGAVTDITERKRSEAALESSEERFRHIVEDFPGYIHRWLPDGTRTYMNQNYRQDFGLTEAQDIGSSFFPIIDESDLAELKSKLATLSESNPTTTGVHKRIKPDGTESWTRWTDRAIYNDQGKLTEYQSVGFDITEQYKANQAVREERQRLARELHDAVSQTLFSANVIAQTLDRVWDRDPDLVRQNLTELQKLTQGALAEMRTLLLELRPTALENTSMADLLQQLTDGFIGRTHTALDLSIEGRDPLPFNVRVSFFRLAQEALNNIIKHARAKKVWVSYNSQDGQVHLAIKDNGLGFDPSSQLTAQHGLNIMRERAESIAADLEITSKPGVGTRIEIEWKGQ